MRFKPGTVLYEIGHELKWGMDLAEEASWEVWGREVFVTSVREGNHNHPESRHYYRPMDPNRWPMNPEGSQGAFDLRTWRDLEDPMKGMLPIGEQERLIEHLQDKLDFFMPGGWDIVRESSHIHVEHDPDIKWEDLLGPDQPLEGP